MPTDVRQREVLPNLIFIILGLSIGITTISYIEDAIYYRQNKEGFEAVVGWLQEHAPNAVRLKQAFYDAGIVRLEKLCLLTVDEVQYLSNDWYFSKNVNLENDLRTLRKEMALKFWLKEGKLEDIFKKLSDGGIKSLEMLVNGLQYDKLAHLLNAEEAKKIQDLWERVWMLRSQSDPNLLDQYPVEKPTSVFMKLLGLFWRITRSLARLILLLSIIALVLIVLATLLLRYLYSLLLRYVFENVLAAIGQGIGQALRNLQTRSRHLPVVPSVVSPRRPLSSPPQSENSQTASGLGQRILNFLFGRRDNTRPQVPFSPNKTSFDFSWGDKEAVVGEMCSITIKFYSTMFRAVECSKIQNPMAVIMCGVDVVPSALEESSQWSFKAKFTPTSASEHDISFYANGICVKSFTKKFIPGAVVPSKTRVKTPSSTIVQKPYMPADLSLSECDKYGNVCKSTEESLEKYTVTVTQIKENGREMNQGDGYVYLVDSFAMVMIFHDIGCYKVSITHGDQPIANSDITFIVLCGSKRKKVYIYLTTKQLLIKEYYMKIIPKRCRAMRIRTTLKFSLLPNIDNDTGYPLMTIEVPMNDPILLACKSRDLVVAAFTQTLLRKTGGADTFDNKRSYLYSELRKRYSGKSHSRHTIRVNRETLLKDSQHAVKYLSDSDWGKEFVVDFINEPGLDFGGVRREWFQVLCDLLFKPENHLFHKSGKDDAQSLIHPNPFRPASLKRLDLYEFAGKIVAKHLIECAFDRQQFVRARFSRAFLSQIIGLDVSWRTFESDDKELYRTKIDYILKNNPEELDLTFTEDVYDDEQNFIKTVELLPGGSRIDVTNDNKLKYLQLSAEYRMIKSVKDEINSFTKGFNALIPENLLSIFDESELELLICGTHEISPMDLKENYVKCFGGGYSFDNTLVWFWEIIFGFSQEELARLLQFTTGSAQLPPGGFKNLNPMFQINSHPGTDVLPLAHTCFNMLCLPVYSSKDKFKRLLLIAVNEGSEGFGFG
ncbi:apoptosis-resistant E3 ubiquitin protein ligase 1-like [Rhopilema esculentum]|uniref:apoptosis-resistant E3 ubiquitin protein ligase 1-like n=1 Tax=Rhopilema esculentum TaxID=499914 RepID=UPI0031D64466